MQASLHDAEVSLRAKLAAGPFLTGSNSVLWTFRGSANVAGIEPFPLTYMNFSPVPNGVQLDLWGGRIHLGKPRGQEDYF